MAYPEMSPEEMAKNQAETRAETARWMRKLADQIEKSEVDFELVPGDETLSQIFHKEQRQGRIASAYSETDEHTKLFISVKHRK